VFNPKLQDKPIVVLSNNDGCIVARSNEAKKMGIGMGEPFFKFRQIIESNRVHVFSSNYTLYGDMSGRVMTTVSQFIPEAEIYSIDEAFLNMSGCDHLDGCNTLTDYARTIREAVKQWTGIPVSIGIARTKTLAKIANRLAKKSHKANGVLNLIDSPYMDQALQNVYVWDVWGVGKNHGRRLAEQGILTAKQLRDMSDARIRKQMGVLGVRLVYELRGISCIPLETVAPPRKGIISSRSFGHKVTSVSALREAVAAYVTEAACKLRSQQSAARLLTVFLMTNHFSKQDKQYSNRIIIHLPVATNDTGELIHYAMVGIKKIFRKGYWYQKAGVMLDELIPDDQVQMNLFDHTHARRRQKLLRTIDRVNSTIGTRTLKYATQGTSQPWKMKSELKSPRYTTSWEELPVAAAN
jgi:DNA polymerase V